MFSKSWRSTLAGVCACFAGSLYACGSSDDGGSVGNAGGGNAGGVGGGNAGEACALGSDCASGTCVDGRCAPSAPGNSPGETTSGPHYGGASSGFRPLTTGCDPNTATECTGACEQRGGDPDPTVVRPPATLCFYGTTEPVSEEPAVVIEQVVETLNGRSYVHLRITFNPSFVDNTYGANASEDWPKGHTFKDLVGSDHTQLMLTNGAGETVMDFKLDYISVDETAQCGYATLGVSGGEGKMLVGDAACVLGAATSLTRNLNHCGIAECHTIDSPLQADEPKWDNRVVYEVWLDVSCFGDAGFGQAYMTSVHASPSKASTNTVTVEPGPCPPEWDEPFCPVSVVEEGGNCIPGSDPDGGSDGPCPVNWQVYVASEGAQTCTPIPYANYPDKAPCPAGYHLDLASEGKYCLPD
jgi:hypothetical protein